MTLVLSPEELVALTGYKHASKQLVWLKKNGFKYRLNRFNKPVVDRTHYLAKMSIGPAKEAEPVWTAKTGANNEQLTSAGRARTLHAPRQTPNLVLLQTAK